MAVYVDWLMNHGWILRGHRVDSCHLFADSKEELVTFALKIGMKRQWLQVGSAIHFDLVESRRIAAVKAGAIELTRETFREAYYRAREQAKADD